MTRDVLNSRGGKGSDLCLFCGRRESIDHLFFTCFWLNISGELQKSALIFIEHPALYRTC